MNKYRKKQIGEKRFSIPTNVLSSTIYILKMNCLPCTVVEISLTKQDVDRTKRSTDKKGKIEKAGSHIL